jgi:hypothetical protein
MKWGLGASFYTGGYATATTNSYVMTEVNGTQVFTPVTIKKGDRAQRDYLGFDGQFSYDWAPGISQVRVEYLTGKQPGVAKSSSSLTGVASADVYNRSFNGYYVYFIQNILESPFQAVVKYDVYDPNKAVSGNEIGQTAPGAVATGSADIKYSTIGVGLNYRFNSNTKIMAYYDIVNNETSSNLAEASTLTDLSGNRKDNVFTLRFQYKF